MLGNVVVRHLSEQGHDVTFTVHSSVPSWFPSKNKMSVIKFDAFGVLPGLEGYDYVINCIGAIKQKKYSDSDFYYLNSVFPWKLSNACQKYGSKLIHISSDCVFSGKTELPYIGNETMDATDVYGMSKAFGEPSGAIVIRTSMIGPSGDNAGLFEWFRTCKDKTIKGYENHIWSGVTTLFLAQFIEFCIFQQSIQIPPDGGIIQVASQPVSKLVLLQNIKNVFGINKNIVAHKDSEAISRILVPSTKYAPDIHEQLVELKSWMESREPNAGK